MQEYGGELLSDPARMLWVTMVLEGEAAEWMVALHNDDVVELCNFDRFMTALKKQFEDPFTNRKART